MNVHPATRPWPTAPSLPAREVDPIVLQIVEGTLNSIEAEIEYAIERTAHFFLELAERRKLLR